MLTTIPLACSEFVAGHIWCVFFVFTVGEIVVTLILRLIVVLGVWVDHQPGWGVFLRRDLLVSFDCLPSTLITLLFLRHMCAS
jgi:hypothetical protein